MTRLPSIGVTKSQQKTIIHNNKATIHWSNKNLDHKLPSIITWLPFNGITINLDNRLPFIITMLPYIGVKKSEQ